MYQKGLAATAFIAMHGAHAVESIRCSRWLVDSSATIDALSKKCGESTSVQSEETDVLALGPHGGMIKVGTSVTQHCFGF